MEWSCTATVDVPTGLVDAGGTPLTRPSPCGAPAPYSASCGVCGKVEAACVACGGQMAMFRLMAEHQEQHRRESV